MKMKRPGVTRRNALRGAAGLLGIGATGALAGGSETLRIAVGYVADSGRRAALDVADEVVYEYSFRALVVEVAAADAGELAGRPDVRYVEEAVEFEAIAQTLPWGVDRIDAEVAAAGGETGAGAHVAVIDTGIDNTHPDLAENLGAGRTFLFGVEASGQQDDMGHGTFCAGVVAAVDNDQGVVGTAPDVTLHGIKAMNAAGVGLSFDIAAAIDHVAEQGYEVANMSFGAAQPSELIRDACSAANDAGVLLVAAAGNSGPCEDCVSYPAAFETVLAVTATDDEDNFASFSSQGPEVELAAPGVEVFSTFLGGTYATQDGTSFACPHVSGTGALLMASGYENDGARRRMKQTAEDVGLSDNEQGSGLVDAAAALGFDSSDDLSGSSGSDDTQDDSGGDESDGDGGGSGGNGGRDDRPDGRDDGGEDDSEDGRGRNGSDAEASASVEEDDGGVRASVGVEL